MASAPAGHAYLTSLTHRATPRPLDILPVGFSLLVCGAVSGCSTALLPGALLDEDAMAERPGHTALDANVRDDAAAARGRDAAAGPDAAVREAALPDAASESPVHDAAAGSGDAGTFACKTYSSPGCPGSMPSLGSRCAALGSQCAYPADDQPDWVLVARCVAGNGGQPLWEHGTAACRHACLGDVPTAFEELTTEDCAKREVLSCDQGAITDQEGADRALASFAEACGLVEYHLGMIMSADGCARALFAREINDHPEIRCVGRHLHAVRFGCAPTCVVANRDLTQ